MVSQSSTGRDALPTATEVQDDGKVDLRGFFGILRERLPLIVITTAAALLFALVYLGVATRIYTGATSLLIDTRTKSAVGDPNTGLAVSNDAVLVESQVRLISSDAVLRRVVDAQNLVHDPEFTPDGTGLRARLFALLGIAPKAADLTAQATLNLAKQVTVKRSERTYIADIEASSIDPIKAARLADGVAQAYLADQQAARADVADRDSDWVRGQIRDMQSGLQDAELKAEAYKREHGILGANGKLLNEQELADASAGLSAALGRATEIKARLDQIKKVSVAGRTVDSLPDALKSPLIDKLKGQYADVSRQQATLRQTLGDRHPALLESDQQLRDIRRLIGEELARVQAGIANEYQTAQANVADLQSRLQTLKSAAILSNEDRVRLDELQRDVDARRAVYDRFLRARDTVREQAVDAPIGRIIAPSRIPTSPSFPKPFAVLAMALGAGLALGIGAALGADLMRGPRPAPRPTAPRSTPVPSEEAEEQPRAAEDDPAVPVLGYVPSPFGNASALATRGGLLDRLRTAWPTTIDAEHVPSLPAFRTSVQALGLLDSDPQARKDKPLTVLVTSTICHESRTTLALGLAEAAAGQGKRAVVIDADESGSILRELVTAGARPTLIDLMGTTRICYRIVAPFRGSLSIVPIMSGEGGLARRLGGQGGADRLNGIASNFDLVVFDGPSLPKADRLEAMAATVETVIVAVPKAATRVDIAEAVNTLGLSRRESLGAVFVAELTEGAAASVAA